MLELLKSGDDVASDLDANSDARTNKTQNEEQTSAARSFYYKVIQRAGNPRIQNKRDYIGYRNRV